MELFGRNAKESTKIPQDTIRYHNKNLRLKSMLIIGSSSDMLWEISQPAWFAFKITDGIGDSA